MKKETKKEKTKRKNKLKKKNIINKKKTFCTCKIKNRKRLKADSDCADKAIMPLPVYQFQIRREMGC